MRSMRQITAACILLCLLAGFLLAAGCTSSGTTGKEIAKPANVTPAITVSPTVTFDSAKPLKAGPADLPKIDVPAGSIAKYYVYTLNGEQGVIGLALPTAEYTELLAKGRPKTVDGNGVGEFQAMMNEPTQQQYITALADEIRKKSSNPDDQARIAVSLVQHIPFHHGEVYRYPYEVMYDGTGVCGEKSMLLAVLLKDLGYGSTAFFFKTENHMTAGIKAAAPYDYKGTGYAFIETTEPKIITYANSGFSFGHLTSTPILVPEGTGKAFAGVAEDYKDAQDWERIQLDRANKTLTAADKTLRGKLDTKYDLSYYTCSTCDLPAES